MTYPLMSRNRKRSADPTTRIGFGDTTLGRILDAMRPVDRDRLAQTTGIDTITLARCSHKTARWCHIVPWVRRALVDALKLDADPLPPLPHTWNRPSERP